MIELIALSIWTLAGIFWMGAVQAREVGRNERPDLTIW